MSESNPPALRRVHRVRHELRRRELQVVDVARPTPHFAAVTFAGESLADFVSASFDDHVKFMFDGADGQPVRRDYTPRAFDRERRTLTIEFALHGPGPAADWARRAAPGQRVVVGGPRGSMIIPTDFAWHLLAGDASALPAIRRRVEELPAGARARVVVQADETDRLLPDGAADVTVSWVSGEEELLAALAAIPLPPGEGFVWCAGEAGAMARVRHLLLVDKRHPREALRVAAYWKRGAAEFHENLEG